ncbi:MAG: hypothetical protein V3T17_05345 [Pseudomonadales bacterium]
MVAINIYYIIKPKPELLAEAEKRDESILDFLSEPQCWEHTEKNPQFDKAKLAFLIEVYTNKPFPELMDFLGEKPISINSFDKWWSIERYEFYGNVDESEDDILPCSCVEFTSNENLDLWLKKRTQNT